MTTDTRTARAKVLVALGVTSLALFAAAPANAMYRSYEPSDAEEPTMTRTAEAPDNGGEQKGCTINLQNPDGSPGQSIKYPHGHSFSVKNAATGKTHTYTCNNGQWVETVSSVGPAGGSRFHADHVYADLSSSLTLVNAHEDYTYAADGGLYTQP